MMDKEFYSIEEIAEKKSISVYAVLDEIEQGSLKAFERCRVSGQKGDDYTFASIGPKDITRIRLEPGQPYETTGWVDDNGYEVTMYHSGKLENIVIDAKDTDEYLSKRSNQSGTTTGKHLQALSDPDKKRKWEGLKNHILTSPDLLSLSDRKKLSSNKSEYARRILQAMGEKHGDIWNNPLTDKPYTIKTIYNWLGAAESEK